MGPMTPFEGAANKFLNIAQGIVDDHIRRNFPTLDGELLVFDKPGRRYQRIWAVNQGTKSRRVYCFLQYDNGDVLKAESWKKPAMHARSNIYDPDSGASGITYFGAKYL